MKKIKKPLQKSETKWISIDSRRKANDPDKIAISFSRERPNKSRHCILRIGVDVLSEMGWDEKKDRLAICYDQDDIYSWMICKGEHALRINKESTNSACRRVNVSWKHPGINFTKSRNVKYIIQKDKITFRVPLDE